MQILFQVLSAIATILAILQKQKWKMMLFYTFNNAILVAMFFAFGRTSSAIISIVAMARTFIYMFYALKKMKPNYLWLIVFESGFIISTVLTWQDALDLMPMFALLSSGYGSWQDNQIVLRISYVINETLYVIYTVIICAYISMSVNALSLICTITCLIYYCILKKETPILEILFKRKKKSFATTVESVEKSNLEVTKEKNSAQQDTDNEI